MLNSFVVVIFGILVNCSTGIPMQPSKYSGTRIIGGEDAPRGFAPHMVALIVNMFWRNVFCGGSIITRSHVLTAAHCIDPYSLNGILDRSVSGLVGSNQWNSGGKQVYFSSYQNHPNWDSEIIKYDVSILILRERLDLNDRVAIIGLDFNWVGEDIETYVTGWGVTGPKIHDNIVHLAPTPDNLQLLHVKTISPKTCIHDVKQMVEELQMTTVPPVLPDVEICTLHSPEHGMCHGDSGSALVLQETRKQIGIVSWGFPCAVGAPDIFTRISGVKDFLEPFIKQMQ